CDPGEIGQPWWSTDARRGPTLFNRLQQYWGFGCLEHVYHRSCAAKDRLQGWFGDKLTRHYRTLGDCQLFQRQRRNVDIHSGQRRWWRTRELRSNRHQCSLVSERKSESDLAKQLGNDQFHSP